MGLESQAPFLTQFGPMLLAAAAVGLALLSLVRRSRERAGQAHEKKLRRVDEDNYIMQDTTHGNTRRRFRVEAAGGRRVRSVGTGMIEASQRCV